jgi:3-hydroxyisobutyrate dehydrogenase-like beta-hydroxyacid dehydrogenase
MGRPMARNLLKGGFEVVAHSRTRAKVDELVQAGGQAGASPADVAARTDLVITIVPDSADVEQVANGGDGVFAGAGPGLIIADMSTISPAVTRRLAQEAAARGGSWLDAPVSGGEAGAIAGTLTIMVGGDAPAFERARPVFEAMGKRVTHIGPSGHGQTAKLCNQVLVAINLLGASEALVLGAKAGLDVDKLHTALSGGAANSWAFEQLGRKMINRDFAPAFKIRLQQKDLRLVSEAAREIGAPTIGTAIVEQLMRVLESQGRGEDGTQSLVTVLEALAGTKVGPLRS